MTPVNLIVLLYCHWIGEKPAEVNKELYLESLDKLVQHNLVTPEGVHNPENGYSTTEKGKKLVEMLCATPLPQPKWSDPRDNS